jgi:hypothetical protein
VESAEARDLIVFESYDADGVLGALRMCDDPGPERMRRLLLALRCLFEDLRGATSIDRRLAAALHGLAVYSESYSLSGSMQGYKWREGLIVDEIPALGLAVESIFAGEWQEVHGPSSGGSVEKWDTRGTAWRR